VIAAYGEHVVMKETLAEALAALFVEPGAAPAVSSTTEEMPLTSPAARRAREALDRYNQAVERLKSGDWKGFGTQFGCNARALGGNEPTVQRPLAVLRARMLRHVDATRTPVKDAPTKISKTTPCKVAWWALAWML